jgi:hypothetical protein
MNAPRFLAGSDFARIVRLTPLVSIDIVVKDTMSLSATIRTHMVGKSHFDDLQFVNHCLPCVYHASSTY